MAVLHGHGWRPAARADETIATPRIAVVCQEDFDLVVETSRAPLSVPYRSGETERAIARHAAALVPEGAVLECGIGNLPNAVLAELKSRKGLRFHSGAIPDGVVELDASGYIPVDREMRSSRPGLFAAGTVRSGSAGRAASAAGDGATAALSADVYLKSL